MKLKQKNFDLELTLECKIETVEEGVAMMIKEVCEVFDITSDTLRYYERVGVKPKVGRTSGGTRGYWQIDLDWIENAICMRSAGPIIVSIVEIVKNKGFGIDEEAEIKGICNIFQMIAISTFQSGEVFNAYEYLYTGQTVGMDTQQKSMITGFITIPDTSVNSIDTSNGKVNFVEFIGVTDAELIKIKNHEMTVKELYEKLGTDVTNYERTSIV